MEATDAATAVELPWSPPVDDGGPLEDPPAPAPPPPVGLVGVLAPLGDSAGLVLVGGGLDFGALASGVDTVTPGVVTLTPDPDALTSGVDTWTSGVETVTPGSVTPTLGTVTPTPGSDTPTPGSDTGSDTFMPGSDRPAGNAAGDEAEDAAGDATDETMPSRRGWAPWASAQLPVSSTASTLTSDAPSAIPPRLDDRGAGISHRDL